MTARPIPARAVFGVRLFGLEWKPRITHSQYYAHMSDVPNHAATSPVFAHSAQPALVPVQESERASSVDTLRGVAVLGILAMNIVVYALPSAAYTTTHNPAINQFAGEFAGGNAIAWWVNHLFFDQKMMSIFSMLFGAGVILLDQRQAARQGTPHGSFADRYYLRLAVLFGIGMVHAYGIWFGDILVAYALCGLLLYPARKLKAMHLIVIGMLVFSVAIVVTSGLGAMMSMMQSGAEEAQKAIDAGTTPSEFQQEMQKAWEGSKNDISPSDAKVMEEVSARRGSWWENFKANALLTFFFQAGLFFMWTLWRSLGLMLVGMGLAKLGFFAAKWTMGSYARLAIAGYVIGLSLIALGATQLLARHSDVGYTFGIGAQFNYVGSLAVALAHASVVMCICKSGIWSGLRNRLAAVGRMAFSNYLSQSIICTFIFFGFGLGYFGRFERGELVYFVIGIWALQLIWSPIWLKYFRFGPAEWLWRSLSYMRLQPMRR